MPIKFIRKIPENIFFDALISLNKENLFSEKLYQELNNREKEIKNLLLSVSHEDSLFNTDSLKIFLKSIRKFSDENEMSVYIILPGKTLSENEKSKLLKIGHYFEKIKRQRNDAEKISEEREKNEKEIKFSKNKASAEAIPFCEEFYCRPSYNFERKKSFSNFEKNKGESFSEMLLRLIEEKKMSETECYKKANIDRKIFSKIRINKDYMPSKKTAVAFAIALKLNLDETNMLLATAGMVLSESLIEDLIVMYHIENGIYDIDEINIAIFNYHEEEKQLGV